MLRALGMDPAFKVWSQIDLSLQRRKRDVGSGDELAYWAVRRMAEVEVGCAQDQGRIKDLAEAVLRKPCFTSYLDQMGIMLRSIRALNYSPFPAVFGVHPSLNLLNCGVFPPHGIAPMPPTFPINL